MESNASKPSIIAMASSSIGSTRDVAKRPASPNSSNDKEPLPDYTSVDVYDVDLIQDARADKIPVKSVVVTQGRSEIRKLVLSIIFQQFCQIIMIFTLVRSNDRMDVESSVLPDIVLDHVPYIRWAVRWSEILLFSLCISFCILLILHKNRILVIRRILAVAGVCMLIRAICISSTVLPRSRPTMECAPKSRNTAEVFHRIFIMYMSSGLGIFGGHMCGNYFFSGHTLMLTLIHYGYQQYTPDSMVFLRRLSAVVCIVITILILLAHNHYTLDILGAFYIGSSVWNIYHFLAHNAAYRTHRAFSSFWTWVISQFEDADEPVIENEFLTFKEVTNMFS